MTRQRLKAAAIVAAIVAICAASAAAYEVAGHYFTVLLLMKQLLPQQLGEKESSLVAFCAQLPDIAEELDALEVYKGAASNPIAWAAWGSNNKVWNKSVAQMIGVQQFLHGLTGGNAKDLQAAARELVQELSLNIPWQSGGLPRSGDTSGLCALGFALHLYGDSFAHRRLDDPDTMYSTGRGHAGDGHKPDRPLSSRDRAEQWIDYLLQGPRPLGKFALDPAVQSHETAAAMKLVDEEKPTWWNNYGEALLRDVLVQRIPVGRIEQFQPPIHEHKVARCQSYVDGIFSAGYFDKLRAPRCAAAWSLFYAKARSVFDRHPDAIAPELRNLRHDHPEF
jgi:hypothetical protein